MSKLYFDYENLKDLDQREDVTLSKAHKARACAVCQKPVDDGQAVPLNIGQGLEVLLHRECMGEIMEALTPKPETIPVSTSKPSVTRKATMPIDQERMAENIKRDVYLQLLKHGLSQ